MKIIMIFIIIFELTCSSKLKRQGGEVYIMYNIGLPGSGKSSLIKSLKSIISNMTNIIFSIVSRDELMKDYIEKHLLVNKSLSLQDGFLILTNNKEMSTDCWNNFIDSIKKELKKMESIRVNKKKIIYIDVNFDYPYIKDNIKKLLAPHHFKQIIVINKTENRLNFLPFSLDYIVQCYHRIITRTHENNPFALDANKNLENTNNLFFQKIANNYGSFISKPDLLYEVSLTDETNETDSSTEAKEAIAILKSMAQSKQERKDIVFKTYFYKQIKKLSDYFNFRFNEIKFNNTESKIKQELLEYLTILNE